MIMTSALAGLSRTLAAQLPSAAPGSPVRVEGWVHRRRVLGAVTFLILRDRSGLVQVVVRDPETLRLVRRCGEESVVAVTGVATRNSAASLRGFRAALDERGFTEIQTPKFVSSATESGASVFRVDYFGRPAYLAQSPQFYKQTMVGVFERVYETGPVFRAEPHDTARHLAEYVSLDAELGFISDHRDVLAVLRHALAGMTAALRAEAQPGSRSAWSAGPAA